MTNQTMIFGLARPPYRGILSRAQAEAFFQTRSAPPPMQPLIALLHRLNAELRTTK